MAIDLDNFPSSESAKKMLSYVSDGFYDTSYVAKWIYEVMGKEYDGAYDIIESLPDQLFPETATWGLMFHELKWGLPVKEGVDFEVRRNLIYQKRDIKRSINPYQMEKMIQHKYGCKAFVSDTHDRRNNNYVPETPNQFQVLIESYGSKFFSDQLNTFLKSIKQSHTSFEINYSFKRNLLNITYGAGIKTKAKYRRIH